MNVKRRARRAREELRSYQGKEPRWPLPEPDRSWYIKYVGLIVDFMCEEVSDERLLRWEDVFTAIYELTGTALGHFHDSDVVTEGQAWASIEPWQHILEACMWGLNPPGTHPMEFLDEYRAFIQFLGDRGVIANAVSDELAAGYLVLAEDCLVDWEALSEASR